MHQVLAKGMIISILFDFVKQKIGKKHPTVGAQLSKFLHIHMKDYHIAMKVVL